MSTSPANNNKVYKHYTSINDLRPVEEDCTQAMILLGSDKQLQVSYPGDNENPIDVDATSDFSNLGSRQSKLTFSTRRSKRVFENQFGEYQSAKRSREESTFTVDTTTSSNTDTNFNEDAEDEYGAAQSDRSQKAAGSYCDHHADGVGDSMMNVYLNSGYSDITDILNIICIDYAIAVSLEKAAINCLWRWEANSELPVEGLMRLMEGNHVGPFNLGNPGEFTMLELTKVLPKTIAMQNCNVGKYAFMNLATLQI
ncbi:hypothetical protein RND71_001905 [Anisodus tanguticus]|uniref:Uncharacterized protein n=1 Tax=Anisodus tanguticus TaxID=243964 RepID=A0AAE1T256_9SOLA|nr:hypothetical protein RND71_001905 [Anisodus tanguticus]